MKQYTVAMVVATQHDHIRITPDTYTNRIDLSKTHFESKSIVMISRLVCYLNNTAAIQQRLSCLANTNVCDHTYSQNDDNPNNMPTITVDRFGFGYGPHSLRAFFPLGHPSV